jgi:hypothetical protein
MRAGILKMLTLGGLLAAVLCGTAAFAEPSGLTPYYFPEGEECTLALDFQPRRTEIEAATGDQRSVLLAEGLLQEFSAQGSTKCPGAKTIRLLAIFIPGVDNYGRPNFPERVNLLRLEGSSDQVNVAATKHAENLPQLKELLTVTSY